MSDFSTVMLRFDPDDGAAEIADRVHVKGMRVVHHTVNGAGDIVFVVRFPPSRYGSLTGSKYAPATFEVFVVDYDDNDRRHGVPEDDHPWIRVRPVVRFPVTIGTRVGL